MTKAQRFEFIDFLRFIMAIAVLCYHALPIINGIYPQVDAQAFSVLGGLCVVFFFIISGFFFPTENKQTMFEFVTKKIIRLWPVLFFSILIHTKSFCDVLNMFFIEKGLGIVPVSVNTVNPASWYVCVLFWLSIIFYLAIKNYGIKNLIFPLSVISFFSLIMVLNSAKTMYYEVCNGIFTAGILWGLFGISFGMILKQIYLNIKDLFDNSILNKLIFTVLELTLFTAFLYLIFLSGNKDSSTIISIFVFTLMFFVFLFNKGILGTFLGEFSKLGRYAYSIYLMQFPAFYIMRKTIFSGGGEMPSANFFLTQPDWLIIIISILIPTIIGILVYHIIEVPIGILLKKFFERIKYKTEISK